MESVNLQALQLFGYAEDELLGHDVCMLMPSPYREQHSHYIQKYLESGQPKVLGSSRIVEALHKEGYVMSLRFSLSEAKSQVRVSCPAFSSISLLRPSSDRLVPDPNAVGAAPVPSAAATRIYRDVRASGPYGFGRDGP
jgi:hypothetical protein